VCAWRAAWSATTSRRSTWRAVRSPCCARMTSCSDSGTRRFRRPRCGGACDVSERPITYEKLLDWLRLIDEGIIEQRGYLTELDSAIGDGDHGTNLSRGST